MILLFLFFRRGYLELILLLLKFGMILHQGLEIFFLKKINCYLIFLSSYSSLLVYFIWNELWWFVFFEEFVVKLVCGTCSYYFLIFLRFSGPVGIHFISLLISVMCVFFGVLGVSFTKELMILVIFLKNQLFMSLIFFYCFLFSVNFVDFCFNLCFLPYAYFWVYFDLLFLGYFWGEVRL